MSASCDDRKNDALISSTILNESGGGGNIGSTCIVKQQEIKQNTFFKIIYFMISVGASLFRRVPRDKNCEISLTSKYYQYFVNTTPECNIWTTSSVPHDIITRWSLDDLSDEETSTYHLDKPIVLLLHGFASGSAFWAMNLDTIVQNGYAYFAIDLPGFAHSSRIKFPNGCVETEDKFVEVIESWRTALKLNKIILFGHSMGAFISGSYTLKFPEFLKHVIFIDPWGFPDLRETITTVMQNSQGTEVGSMMASRSGWVRVFSFLMKPFSPLSILRLSGRYLGPKLINSLRPDMTKKFVPAFGQNDFISVNEYIYQINSGEEAFRNMTHPLGWAKNPLINRILNCAENIPFTFVYGSRSWISCESGYETREKSGVVNVLVVEDAGHHVFMDQPTQFNDIISKVLQCDMIGHYRIETRSSFRIRSSVTSRSDHVDTMDPNDDFSNTDESLQM